MYQDKGQCHQCTLEGKTYIPVGQELPQSEEEKRDRKKIPRSMGKLEDRVRPYSWGLRNYVQLGVFLVTVGIGIHFFIYVHQAAGAGAITVSRPAGVEGFLPIGALLGWKLFALTGIWDPIHPAAMVILGFAALISLGLRKSFCGWFCPIGTLSEWMWKAGRIVFGGNFQLPPWLDFPLRTLKYLFLAFFVWTIFSMSRLAILAFLQGPYYKMSDVKMLFFFTHMSAVTAVSLIALALVSLAVRNFWCRVISPECNGCMDCTVVCPAKNTLELRTLGVSKKGWSATRLGAVIIVLYLGLVYAASITGHWKSSVSEKEFRARLQDIHSARYTHP